MSGTPDEPDFAGLDGGEAQQEVDIVRAVMAWYTAQIVKERRAPVPDEDRITQLTADRAAVYHDLDRLPEEDPEERSQLAARYAARLKELEAS